MIVSVLAAGLFLFADSTAAQPGAPAQAAPAKPAMHRVCVKIANENDLSRMAHLSCTMEPVVVAQTAPTAKVGDKTDTAAH